MHWPFDFARNSLQQQQGYATAMNTVDDISYCPSAEEKTRNAEQIDVTGRRNWKLMKGKKEAVWPPNLEAVLLEALKTYKPHSSKPLEQLGRFPMRNRFISDYIYEMTGKRRTPKQVGSRLQQLRDTCKKAELLKLISRHNINDEHPKNSTQSQNPHHSLIRSQTPPNEYGQQNIVDVEVVLDDKSGPFPIPAVTLNSVVDSTAPLQIRLSPPVYQNIPPALPYTELSGKCSTIEIHSLRPLFYQTIFSVFCRGSEKSTHYEVGSLRCHSSPPETRSWIYSSALIPAFWDVLCGDKEPTKYTIQQGIIPLRPLPGSHHTDRSEMTITLVYRFIFPPNKTNIEHEGKSFPLYTTLPLNPNLLHERFEHDGSGSPQSVSPSSRQSPYTVNQNAQSQSNPHAEVISPYAPFSYQLPSLNNGNGGCIGGGSPQRCCLSRSSWLQQSNLHEDRLLSNAPFYQVEYPISF